MIDQDCSGAGLLKAQDAAVELYQLAALMLGSQADALSLVEQTVSEVEVDPCGQEQVAVAATRRQLVAAAVEKMRQADPEAFLAPASAPESNPTCIEDDDLSAAGITPSELSLMLADAGSDEMRLWLEQLPLAQRAIFVQRAVLGWDNSETAKTLRQGPDQLQDQTPGWQPEQVSDVFRQALCSLANSLVHSAAAHKFVA